MRATFYPLPHGGRQKFGNPIRARQAAQVAGFTLGARNKKPMLEVGRRQRQHSVHTAGANNRERRDCKKRIVKFHKILLFEITFGPEFHVCYGAESGASPQRCAISSRTDY